MIPIHATGPAGHAPVFVYSARRTESDRRPPRAVLTARLMGDPRPDRYVISDAIRTRLCGAMPAEPVVSAKVLAVLEALADGPLTLAHLADEMAVSLSAGSERAQAARLMGLVERLGGRPCRVDLTPAGRVVLAD
jgi:predicted Rossmann fold nucleotide-binding protein DprA/Smf involved in DNA uptake